MAGTYGAGSITRRADGRYEVRVSVDGKVIRKYARTEEEAEKIRRALVREKQRGKLKAPPRRLKVDTLLDRWLLTKESPEVDPATLAVYVRNLAHHVRSHLGHRNAATLEPLDVQEWLRELARGGLSSKMLAELRSLLSGAFKWAVSVDLLTRNPAAGWRTPRGKAAVLRLPPDEKAARAFLEKARDHRLAALWYLCAYLGLRRGELLGVTWGAIDLTAGTIDVSAQLKRRAGEWILDTPKSDAGRRVLPLVAPLPDLLARRRREQLADCLRTGAGRPALDLAFTTRQGSPLDTRALGDAMHNLAPGQGMTPHRYRHNVATWLLEMDAPDRIIRAFLGHVPGSVTGKYQHPTVEILRPWAVRIADRWRLSCAKQASSTPDR